MNDRGIGGIIRFWPLALSIFAIIGAWFSLERSVGLVAAEIKIEGRTNDRQWEALRLDRIDIIQLQRMAAISEERDKTTEQVRLEMRKSIDDIRSDIKEILKEIRQK